MKSKKLIIILAFATINLVTVVVIVYGTVIQGGAGIL